jgi:energy-coupling factor transporter transmembrane protein EcfT
MNYKIKFIIFIIVFIVAFFTLRIVGEDLYRVAYEDLGGIPWLFSTIGLIFSILSGFLIQHLWDKWERIQKIVLEEIHVLDHIMMFIAPNTELQRKTQELIKHYVQHIIDHEWSPNTRLLESNEATKLLKTLHDEFFASENTASYLGNKGILTKLMNSLFHTRERRILLTTRRMPDIIKNTFLLSASLVVVLSLFVGIKSIFFDFIFTVSIGSLVCAIYLIVDDMDDILSPGEWHVSSKLYREFLKKIG